MTVNVKGITELGTNIETRYLVLGEKNDFEAIKHAIDWANDEYNVLRDENGCPILELATMIWLCSDEKWCIRDIVLELNEAGFTERKLENEKERLEDWLGI